jgi:hypothetical protein
MAEIALPLVAFGALYLASNQKKTRENFSASGLSGVNPPLPEKNYPTEAPVRDTNARKYGHPAATDKFYANDVADVIAKTNPPGSVGSGCMEQRSLTGDTITKEQFTHNNMVPFFGGRVRGATLDADCAESRLDNMQGSGSQMIRKSEQAPLFQPQKDLQYAHGAPNRSEFMLSRVNPSNRMANVKPWDEEKIAPGLGLGYTTTSGPGFNAGMGARDQWLPKTVNELRVDTNPKMTFGLQGHEGPALAPILEPANKATQGKVEKYLPDTYYEVGPSRWFTTTGLEHAPRERGIEVLQSQNRSSTSSEYYGTGKDGEAGYVTGNHEAPKRPCLGPNAVTNAVAAGQYHAREGDFGAASFEARPNNRATTNQPENYGGVYGLLKAAVAPVLDVLRPSRKENVIGNARPNGNVSTTMPEGPIFNPADRLKTTIKETTEGKLDCNHLNVENQAANAYLVSKQQPVDVQRDSTNCSYLGSAGPGEHAATMSYDSNYRQRNNPNKTYVNRPNQGGTQIFNQQENISIHRRDADRNNNRMWAPHAAPTAIPSQETYGKINAPQYYDQCTTGCDRIDPNLLSAFKTNPYTQSLQSWA